MAGPFMFRPGSIIIMIKRCFPDVRHPQSRTAIFWPHLHRLRLWQGQRPAGAGFASLFGIMSKTPFAELNNPPFRIATTLGTASAFVLALVRGRLVGRLSFREATLAGRDVVDPDRPAG